jgi:hypothetical protein
MRRSGVVRRIMKELSRGNVVMVREVVVSASTAMKRIL